jgi:hypothetical protein
MPTRLNRRLHVSRDASIAVIQTSFCRVSKVFRPGINAYHEAKAIPSNAFLLPYFSCRPRDLTSATNGMETEHHLVRLVTPGDIIPAHRNLDPVIPLDLRIRDPHTSRPVHRGGVDQPEPARLDPVGRVPDELRRRLVSERQLQVVAVAELPVHDAADGAVGADEELVCRLVMAGAGVGLCFSSKQRKKTSE